MKLDKQEGISQLDFYKSSSSLRHNQNVFYYPNPTNAKLEEIGEASYISK